MTQQDRIAVMTECKRLTLSGEIAFPEVVRRLLDIGVERYHVDFTRSETTYYLPDGESHVQPLGMSCDNIATAFSADGVGAAVKRSQRGEHKFPEFVAQATAAGCVGYFAQLTGRRVVYFGRDGDTHVERFPDAK